MSPSAKGSDALLNLLVDAWSAALETEITAESDFFELGGDSVAAISIARAVSERYGDREDIEVEAIQAVFEQATPGGMAKALGAFIATADERVEPDAH